MHDDDDLDALMNEIDDGNVSMKVTPKIKKSKKVKKIFHVKTYQKSSVKKASSSIDHIQQFSRKISFFQKARPPAARPKSDKTAKTRRKCFLARSRSQGRVYFGR